MLKLNKKKRLVNQGNLLGRVQRVRWWLQIVKSTLMTSLGSSRHPPVNQSEPEVCYHHKQIPLQWAGQQLLEELVSGIGWWKKGRTSLRQVLTLKTTLSSKKLTDKSNPVRSRVKLAINKQPMLHPSIREWQRNEENIKHYYFINFVI